MSVWAITVNYRTPDLCIRAARSTIAALKPVNGHLFIVDNDSGDGSADKIEAAIEKEAWNESATLVRAPKNGGFGYGNNQVLRKGLLHSSPPEYYYLINSDAFPEPDAISVLVEKARQHPQVGIIGSGVFGVDGAAHETAFRFPSVWSEFEHTVGLGPVSRLLDRFVVALEIPDEDTQVDWLAGASMLLRHDMLQEIGLFDERYFLYFEEVDLCLRAARKGWQTLYVPASRVAHVGSASTGLADTERRTPTFWFDSRSHYFRKNHGFGYLQAANLAYVGGSLIRRIRGRRERVPYLDRPRILRDFISHNLPWARLRP